MARKPTELTEEQVKAAADMAEGLAPDNAEDGQIGRPSNFQPEYAEQTRKLCELGATDIELADFFDVSVRTIYRWQIKYPAFSQALKAAKNEADERVERSLFHKAVGYSYEGEKIFQYEGQIVRAKTREHVPPDTTACIFWLKNRRQQQWRDVHKLEHGQPGDFDRLSDADLIKEIQLEAQELGAPVPNLPAIIPAKQPKANGVKH